MVLRPRKSECQTDPFEISNHQDSNGRETIRDLSFNESLKTISMGIQSLIKNSKSGVLEKEELENRDNLVRTALLPFLVNQHSHFGVENFQMSLKNE